MCVSCLPVYARLCLTLHVYHLHVHIMDIAGASVAGEDGDECMETTRMAVPDKATIPHRPNCRVILTVS